MSRPAGVSAHVQVGEGHVGTTGNREDEYWITGVLEKTDLDTALTKSLNTPAVGAVGRIAICERI